MNLTEDYCSFEISKLLKEKGFDWMCNGYYNKDDEYSEPYFGDGEGADNWNNQAPSVRDLWFSAPTHQMAMKWLREVHGIMIITYVAHFDNLMENYSNSYFSEMFNLADDLEQMGNTGYYATYEEAVEAAIKYSLENLI